MRIDNKSLAIGAALGGLGFVLVSYVLHCKFGLGPWPCQRTDPRRIDALFELHTK